MGPAEGAAQCSDSPLFRRLTVPLACVRCEDGVLTISATYQNVLLSSSAHAQWKLVKFRQGVQMVKVRAKLPCGPYKSNTEVKFRQAITDGYD